MSCDPLKHRFLDFFGWSRIFGWSSEENEFPVPGDHLKHRFLVSTKDEFCSLQEAKNDFYVPFEHLNHRFIDLKMSHFQFVKKQKMTSSDFNKLKLSPFRPHPNRILG